MSTTVTLKQLKDQTIVSHYVFAGLVFLKIYKYVNGEIVHAEPYGSMLFEHSSKANAAIEHMREQKCVLSIDDDVTYQVAPYDIRRDHSLSMPTVIFRVLSMGGENQIHHLNSIEEWKKLVDRLIDLEQYRCKEMDGRHVILNPIGQYVSDHSDVYTAMRLTNHLNELRDAGKPKRSKV